ncbi:MAG TPA: GNAT family N-acetyltransferase [Acidobacteriota bacterium]|nr:GNAT family N-acetyltransferase [Acidobacteriota bacterium]
MITIRQMTRADIAAANRLRELAGWNQTERDWERFLRLSPGGCFVACLEGKVRGTATTLNYENRFGWVGMILVDPECRKQGIGTQLLEAGIDYLERIGVETVKLDATPMGHSLYLQHGFVDEYGIERWERARLRIADCGLRIEDSSRMRNDEWGMRNVERHIRHDGISDNGLAEPFQVGGEPEPGFPARNSGSPSIHNPQSTIRNPQFKLSSPITQEDLERACTLDRSIFGADRSELLFLTWRQDPSRSAVVYSGDDTIGYIFGREGARAYYLGPWVAQDNFAAEQLLSALLLRLQGQTVYVDICLENPHAKALVKAAGFTAQRPLTRMYRGWNHHPGQPKYVCGIAGPELG